MNSDKSASVAAALIFIVIFLAICWWQWSQYSGARRACEDHGGRWGLTGYDGRGAIWGCLR